MVMAYLSPHLSILLLLLAVLSSFTKSYLLIPQKETTNIDLFQSLLQIYEKAFIEVENMEESETYIKHFETKHYSYTNDIPVLILPHRFLPTIGYGNNLCRWLNVRILSYYIKQLFPPYNH